MSWAIGCNSRFPGGVVRRTIPTAKWEELTTDDTDSTDKVPISAPFPHPCYPCHPWVRSLQRG